MDLLDRLRGWQSPDTMTSGEVTFRVADVEPTVEPLAESHCQEVMRTIAAVAERKPTRLEYYSRTHQTLVRDVYSHPLVSAVSLAFAEHRPLALSPDMIWLLITQGVAQHINLNAERFRSKLVAHEGKKEIKVLVDWTIPKPEDWERVVRQIAEAARKEMNEKAQTLFLATFSTTGPVEAAVSQIVLLDAVQRFFDYRVNRICGIPSITLEGSVSDWESIALRAEAFAALDLDWWIKPLRPVLRQFVDAAGGRVDVQFWRSIYRIYDGMACRRPETALGWIYTFFPYFYDGGRELVPNSWLFENRLKQLMSPPRDKGSKMHLPPGIADSALPIGLSKAPFSMDENSMEFLGGFVGVSQNRLSLRLRPEIGWAIRNVTAEY
jgi:hypothetical protein